MHSLLRCDLLPYYELHKGRDCLLYSFRHPSTHIVPGIERVINQCISEPLSPAGHDKCTRVLPHSSQRRKPKQKLLVPLYSWEKLRFIEFRQTLMTLQGGSGKAGTWTQGPYSYITGSPTMKQFFFCFFFFLILINWLIDLAASGLSCGMQDLLLRCTGSLVVACRLSCSVACGF